MSNIEYCFIGFLAGIILNWILVAIAWYIMNKERESSIFYINPKDKE